MHCQGITFVTERTDLSPSVAVVVFCFFFLLFSRACSCYCFTCVWSWFFSISFVRTLCQVVRKSFHFNSSSFMVFTITCTNCTHMHESLGRTCQRYIIIALVITLSVYRWRWERERKKKRKLIRMHTWLNGFMKDMPWRVDFAQMRIKNIYSSAFHLNMYVELVVVICCLSVQRKIPIVITVLRLI